MAKKKKKKQTQSPYINNLLYADDYNFGVTTPFDQKEQALINLSDVNTARTFQFNSDQAQIGRDWQESMSNTAHQREVADLQKAGLNPVLSAGGAGSPNYTTSVGSGTAENPDSSLSSIINSKINSSATIKAAKISADMVKKSAEIAARASYNSALVSAEANRYSADRAYDRTVYQTDYGRSGSVIGTAGSMFNWLASGRTSPRGGANSASTGRRSWQKPHFDRNTYRDTLMRLHRR